MNQCKFIKPIVLESDNMRDPNTLEKRRHYFTDEQVSVLADGDPVRITWDGASWKAPREVLAIA